MRVAMNSSGLNHMFQYCLDNYLLIVGFIGQGFFSGRFFVQWIASERQGRSVVPLSFWYFSMGGGGVLLVYAILKKDPVFILGQAAGLVIYLRNLYLIRKGSSRQKV